MMVGLSTGNHLEERQNNMAKTLKTIPALHDPSCKFHLGLTRCLVAAIAERTFEKQSEGLLA